MSDQPSTLPTSWTPSQFKPKNAHALREHRHETSATTASTENKKRNIREYTLGEEIFNSVTHGIGALLAIAAIPILVVHAVERGGGVYLFAALVYTLTMLLEYVMSTLYHALAAEKAKRVFKVLDHSCIYLFIAGTYTPFCLITLGSVGGVYLCIFVLYLLLGWSVVAFLPQLIAQMNSAALWLLALGGLSYTIGCIFYVLKRIPYMHSIFHIWVLLGSVLQFLAIALYVI